VKITSFYFLAYPDCSPPDPLFAASEVYVEVAFSEGTLSAFDATYAFNVCTLMYAKKHLETHSFLLLPSLIIVSRFEDNIVKQALEAVLPDIDSLGIKK
jgi:hypothetical protein